MAHKPSFTTHEAVLLLDAYLNTMSGEMTRIEAINNCSRALRQMAVNDGIEIDEIYRNFNGISFQMASMESAFQGRTIRKPATRLFMETVELYRTNRTAYDKLLREAKIMAGEKQDNETLFMEWLSEQVSNAQLSELYICYKDIEKECKKTRVVRDSLFEELSPVRLKKIRSTIEQSKMFRFWHKKNMGKYLSALRMLASYAEERENARTAVPTPSEPTPLVEDRTEGSVPVAIGPAPTETELMIPEDALGRESSDTDSSPAEDSAATDDAAQIYTIDFTNFRRFSYTKPVSISYFEDLHSVGTWRELLIKACELLIDDYPEVMARLCEEGKAGKNTVGLRDAGSVGTLRRAIRINDSYFIEGNLSASDIVRVI